MKSSAAKTLGERIRELREKSDLSLREFGRKLGDLRGRGQGDVTAAFLSDIELGRRNPSEKVLANMARVLGTTVEDLESYDVRPAVEGFKRLVAQNPALGLAFRKALDKDISPEELIKMVEKKDRNKT